MKKRLFALLLALVLALSLLPMAALADETEPAEETPVEQSESEEPVEEPAEEPAEEAPVEEPAEEPAGELAGEPAEEPAEEAPVEEVTAATTNLDSANSDTAVVAESGDGSAPSGSITDSGTTVAATQWSYFRDGTRKLTEDVTVTASIESMGEVTLDLNGHTLACSVNNVIYVSSGTLTIIDSAGGGRIVGANCDSSAGVIIVNDGAKLVLNAGTLTGGVSTRSGGAGGVYVGKNSEFTMNGGTITSCQCTGAGGGAVTVVSDGSFTMNGGTISACRNTGGGSGSGGAGGVCVFSGGSFTMTGGTITGCSVQAHSADYVAGGVCVMNATFTMNDGLIWLCGASGLTVGENQKHSGGVYIGIGSTFWANRGEISECYEQEVPATSDTVNRDLVNNGDMRAADGAAGLTVDTLHNNSTNGAIYNVTVKSDNPLINYGEIRGGTFHCSVENKMGIIYGGTFNKAVTNYCGPSGFWGGAVHASIEGGTFNGQVTNKGGWITGGTFKGVVYNEDNDVKGTAYPATISGGTFENNVINKNNSTISGGTFTYGAYNYDNAIVSGGDFSGTVGDIFKVKFDLDGKGSTMTQWRANAPATEPTVPTTTGYDFHYWYDSAGSSSTAYPFTEKITSDTTLKAKWLANIDQFRVSEVGRSFEYQKGITQQPSICIFDKDWNYLDSATFTLGGTTSATDAGTYVLTVTGTGEYNGTMDCVWRITKKNVDNLTHTVNGEYETATSTPGYPYDGTTHTPTIVIVQGVGSNAVGSATKYQEVALEPGKDYTLSGALSGKEAGTYTITATGIGNYTGTKTITWKIEPAATTCTVPTGLTATYGQLLMDVAFPNDANGTWAWEKPTQSVGDVGTNTFNAVYTPNDSNYQSVTKQVTVSVGPRNIGGASVRQKTAIEYSGTVRTPAAGMLSVMLDGRVLNTDSYKVEADSQKNAGTYTMTVTGQGNYTGSITANWTITPKSIRVSSATAQDKTYDGKTTAAVASVTFEGLVDGESLELGTDHTASASFADASAGTGKTVTVTVTLGDTAKAKNYTLSTATVETTAKIEKRAVTITSADNSKAYDGTALTNGDKSVTVSGSGMVTGEEFDYDFTASQTDIGSTDNTFTVQGSTTARPANYTVTPVYGTLTVTVPTDVATPVEGIDEDNVKQTDRETIENTLDAVDDYLDMEPSEAEKEALQDLKDRLEELIDKLDEVRDATEDETITSVDDINAGNATSSDKEKLEEAKEAIEDILDHYGDNLTEGEKKALEDDVARIEAALQAIEQAKQTGQTEQTKKQAVKTGDDAMPMLWLALAAMSMIGLGLLAGQRKVR